MNFRIVRIAFFIFILFPLQISAESYSFSEDKTVIGFTQTYIVQNDESLIEIARKFGLGYNEIAAANPDLDPFVPGKGAAVIIPSSWILPETATSYEGIIINLSEMRLYYFFSQGQSNLVNTFPIGIGTEGNDTPVGNFTVIEKIESPSWHVPESIRQEYPHLPKVVPPGPDNPLGSHAIRLSAMNILIHGTHRPFGVGRKVSHGCIRLYPEDIPKLFKIVPNKTKVTIVRQPVKVGIRGDQIFIEVHKDKSLKMNYFDETVRLLRKNNLYGNIDKEKMISTIRQNRGIPVNITEEKNQELRDTLP